MIITGLLGFVAITGIVAIIISGIKIYKDFGEIFTACFMVIMLCFCVFLPISALSNKSNHNPTTQTYTYQVIQVKVGQQNLRYSLRNDSLIETHFSYNSEIKISPTGEKYYVETTYQPYWGLWLLHLPKPTDYTIYVTEQDYQRLVNIMFDN